MANYWQLVNRVIDQSDILLLVLDSRFPQLTRNKEIERKIKDSDKRILYVLNKCDLVDEVDAKDFHPHVIVSSRDKLGTTKLLKKILELVRGEECVVGVLGYPNVGKSSVINLLKGKKSASTSSVAGHTRSIQLIKAKGKIRMLDTPGVFEFDQKDEFRKVAIGCINPQQLKEPEYYLIKLMEEFPVLFKKYFKADYKDAYEFINEEAARRGMLLKKGEADTQRFSRQMVHDWITGKVHEASLTRQPEKEDPIEESA
ncbi:MAG: 50S ribosome-binding GTPase [Candidatus Woesearchaeota archaeon]|nr:50S ribosome-binding GTPase [Candidatus Woesearchaeota archaeon]